MDNAKRQPGLNITSLNAEDCKMYHEKLSRRTGAKEKAIAYSGLSRFSYYKVMKGDTAKKSTVQKVINANAKVIKLFIDNQAS